jgi:hypothetical protein
MEVSGAHINWHLPGRLRYIASAMIFSRKYGRTVQLMSMNQEEGALKGSEDIGDERARERGCNMIAYRRP